MPVSEIIDNRNQKLADHINQILDSTERARFAVGYFFVSGLECISQKLEGVKELRLLIGNTTNRETLEQLAEGYHRLELVSEAVEGDSYPKKALTKLMANETGENVKLNLGLMDQTHEGEALLRTLTRLIEEKRLKVRIYTKGRLHAKAYIFDYGDIFDKDGKPLQRHEKGLAIVGSSNLTLSGVTHNTELNVLVQGNENHQKLTGWFDDLWNESQEFEESLMNEMKSSWAIMPATPYDIYMKTLYTLVQDRLDGEDDKVIMWDDDIYKKLASFQQSAVRQGIQMIRDNGGAFISDVVGLGKSYIGAAIIKHFERTEHARPLVICPAPLKDMWERYNEVYQLNARVLSMGLLRDNAESDFNFLLTDSLYKDRDFVLIDESHNLRNPGTQRYQLVQSFIGTGRKCCLLTATPQNKSSWDIYYQIKLFHQEESTLLPIEPPILKEYFKKVESNERKLPDLLRNILIRRTRAHILKWYGLDGETHQKVDPSQFSEYLNGNRRAYVMVGGRHQYFPKRDLRTIEYSIEDTYQGLYRQIREYIGKPGKKKKSDYESETLIYAKYGLWHYVKKEKQKSEPYIQLHRAGINLRGLARIILFKRFESSVYAFRTSVERNIKIHQDFLKALEEGIIPAGEEAQSILYASTKDEEDHFFDALRNASGKYKADDFDVELLIKHIQHDISIYQKLHKLVEPITSHKDAKLQKLIKILSEKPLQGSKRLIFTQYADTAEYLYSNLNPEDKFKDIDVIYSGDKSKIRIVGRFAPKANPEYTFQHGESELNTVIATDVLAEGLNLQDCDHLINYDLHWNPVRLIQRFGRIDRIGSEHDIVYGYNFLPETGLDKNLGLKDILHHRIQDIHDAIGEDAQILDHSEKLNEKAMYAIYEEKGEWLFSFEEPEDENIMDLNEGEEILRQLKKDNPGEFERIANLRDGIRSVKSSRHQGFYVFCEACNPNRPDIKGYQQLFLSDGNGEIISKDITNILTMIVADPETHGEPVKKNHNQRVMTIKQVFNEEVKHRQTQLMHSTILSLGQRYIIRELRAWYAVEDDEENKVQINILEQSFSGSVSVALNKELNRMRRNGLTGKMLIEQLKTLYHQHNMRTLNNHNSTRMMKEMVTKIICSEELVDSLKS